MERIDHGYLEDELEIKTSSKFISVTKSDTLEVFESYGNVGCMSIFALLLSILLYFVDKILLIVFFLTLAISAIGYIWRYKYTFKKKAALVINSIGITEKDHLYLWAEMLDLSYSEEFDYERGLFNAPHLRFIYRGDVKKIYIGGYDKSKAEIIHYVASLKPKTGVY